MLLKKPSNSTFLAPLKTEGQFYQIINHNFLEGPFVDGWPPGKDRYMPNYIKPDQDTFLLRPSKDKFENCDLLVIVHSTFDNFQMRMAVRDTWIKFVDEGRVENVSVIFLIGNQNAFNNLTEVTR